MAEGKIKYAQARPPDAKELTVPSAEMFMLHINAAFGSFPIELGEDQLERLEGMKAVSKDPLIYDTLIRSIKRYGSIRVWREQASVREVLEEEAKARQTP